MFIWPIIVETLPAFIDYVVIPVCEKAAENAGKIILGAAILIATGTILTNVSQNQNETTFNYEKLPVSDGEFYENPNDPTTGFDYHYNKHVVNQHEYDNLILYSPGSQESKDSYRESCKDSANK